MEIYEDPINVAETARRIGITRTYVYYLIKTGELEAMKVADHWVVDGSDVDRLIREREAPDHAS